MSRYRDVLNELTTARDELRLKLHLFSLDAKDKWSEIEEGLNQMEQDVRRAGSDLTEKAEKELGLLELRLRQKLESIKESVSDN